MFRKLKIQLILINLVLTSIVLITIFSGIYVLMDKSFANSSYMKMIRVAEMESLPPSHPEKDLAPSDSFFVKTNNNGMIYEVSGNSIIPGNSYGNTITEILRNKRDRGNITYGEYKLRYLKTPKKYGYIIVFMDRSFDSEVLKRLVVISITICALSLVMVFIISLFLANISLKPIISAWDKQKAFVADASHELRTPLAVITTNMDIVLDNKNDTVESQKKWLGNVKMETSRMTKLIEALLFIARSDSGKSSLDFSKFNLSDVVKQSIMPFEAVAISDKIIIIPDIEPDAFLFGNEERIKQLVAILVDNAVKHTPSGGTIKVGVHKVKNKIELIVEDTGDGIAQEHLNKIFERFYKVDKSRTKRNGNFGLGLSIAKCIVEEHKGSIDVSSEVGRGSIFKVVF